MSLERKKSDCNVQETPSGSNECLLQKRSTKHRDSVQQQPHQQQQQSHQQKKNDQMVPRMYSGDDVEVLRVELENETRNR